VENVWIHYARSKGGYQDPLRYPWSPLAGKSDGAMLIGSNGSVDSDVGEFEIGDEDFEDYKIISNLQRAFEDGSEFLSGGRSKWFSIRKKLMDNIFLRIPSSYSYSSHRRLRSHYHDRHRTFSIN
jgi:hypothetical protein